MPKTYMITFKDSSAFESFVTKTKSDGPGTIVHEYKFMNAVAVSIPDGHVHALDSEPGVTHVEEDSEVRTQ